MCDSRVSIKKTAALVLLSTALCLGGCFQSRPTVPPSGGVPVGPPRLTTWLRQGGDVSCRIETSEGAATFRRSGRLARVEEIAYPFGDRAGSPGVLLAIGNDLYFWNRASGTKVSLIEADTDPAIIGPDEQAEIWEKAGYAYECEETAFGDAVFTVPAEVEFVGRD
jgi:hypothetical protein